MAAELAAGNALESAVWTALRRRGLPLAREGDSAEPALPERCISMAENAVT